MDRKSKQIEELVSQVISMALLCQESLKKANEALLQRKNDLAKAVIEGDVDIDRFQKDIETSCFRLLLLEHPVAHDFLLISASLKMITDLERIGDYAADIAEEVISYPPEPYIKPLIDLTLMGEGTIAMLEKAIRSFASQNVVSARELAKDDDNIDMLFMKVRHDLAFFITRDEKASDQAMILMMVAKFYERIGDHIVNLGEWIDYAKTGTHRDS